MSPLQSGPLSYGQRALWFLQQLDPQSGAYNVKLAARINGRVDAAALRDASGGPARLRMTGMRRVTRAARANLEMSECG